MRQRLIYLVCALALSTSLFATSFEEGVAAYGDTNYPKAIGLLPRLLRR